MFKKFIFILSSFLSLPVYALDLPHDGFLKLFHSHSQERLEIQYEKDGKLIPSALDTVNKFMRSRDEGAVTAMNGELLQLLDHLQDHFKADTVEIICGYRSAAFNQKLYTSGHNVARESYHTMGMAADIHIDEVPEIEIVHYLKKLNLGGIGYYPRLMMVHVDVGIKRFWQEDAFVQRIDIGEQPIVGHTDKLFYFDGNKQTLKGIFHGDLILEHFVRGQWISVLTAKPSEVVDSKLEIRANADLNAQLTKQKGKMELKLPYGKFRWKMSDQSGIDEYSNEFYVKRPI